MDRPISAFLVLLAASVSLSAQWLQYREPGIPRTPDGKPNFSAPPPKTPDGKPDLSGVWAVANSELAPDNNRQAGPNQFLDIAPDDKGQPYHRLPYQPGMAEIAKARDAPPKTSEPHSLCLPDGFMVQHTWGNQLRKIIQTPKVLVILLEYNAMYRQIFTDGRPLPTDPNPAWNGYSTGKWEGDTLVVESSGFKDGQWLDTRHLPVRVFVLRAGDQFTVENLAAGAYDIRYQDLDSGIISKSETLFFYRTNRDGHILYPGKTVTLYSVLNPEKKIHFETIGPDEF